MASIVARIVLESLIKLIKDEANLLSGVKDQVNLLQGDLGFMIAFLKNSVGKHSENHIVKELVDQIRDVSLEAEDDMNTYIAEVIKHTSRRRLGKLFHSSSHAKMLHRVANKTKSIKGKIENIYNNKEKYQIGEADQSNVHKEAEQELHRRRRNVEEDDVVGFINDTATLISQLTDRTILQREVISIIGMGGLGKTTLARKIYNNTHVKNHFHCCVWISVSQEWKITRLLLDILKSIVSISDEIYKMSDEELKVILHDNLQGKRYLVVMDDIWKTQVWDEIRAAFPDESNGSRILITSREKEVSSHASSTPYFLPFLNNHESWELLRKKVFRGEKCPSNLESQGRQLAESCKGLPLSLLVLGGILSNKEKSPRIWSKFIGRVNSYLTEDRTGCLDILALSYNHLPHKLKPCFLYVGMFPEDYEIQTQELIKLWISERLVQQIGNRKVEDVAEDCIGDLIDRSLVQVASRRIDGSVETCRIHDLLRDLCIKESDEEKLFEVRSEANLSSPGKPRRLSIHYDSTRYVSSNATCDTSSARSLLFFCQEGDFVEEQWEWVLKGFKFIRVFRLFDVRSIKSIPEEMEKLIFLRHLSIKSKSGAISPHGKSLDYLCNLVYLETLDIQFGIQKLVVCRVTTSFSQKSIWRMKQLRYLNVDTGFRILPDQRQRAGKNNIVVDTLCNLHVIHSLVVETNTSLVISKSPNLTELTLCCHQTFGGKSEVAEVLISLKNLRYLQRLHLHGVDTYHGLKVFPLTLTKVTLSSTSVCSNMMKILGKLPNLLHLKMESASPINGMELKVVAGEFPQLQVLELTDNRIESWEMERDAMPNLERLVIFNYHHMRINDVPAQLWHMRGLRFLKITTRRSRFYKR